MRLLIILVVLTGLGLSAGRSCTDSFKQAVDHRQAEINKALSDV